MVLTLRISFLFTSAKKANVKLVNLKNYYRKVDEGVGMMILFCVITPERSNTFV